MHVKAFVRATFKRLVQAHFQQLQIDQTLRQYFHRGIVRVIETRTRLGGLNRCVLCIQHHFIHSLLGLAELSVHRKGTGDIGCVAIQLATCINQQQVTVAHFGVVGPVMQHTGICTRGHN